MTSPKWAKYVNGARHYANPNKLGGAYDYLSISHIASAIEKPGLTWFAAGAAATEAVDHQAKWMDLPRDEAWRYLRGRHDAIFRAAGTRGTMVHQVIEDAIRGVEPSEEAKTDPMVRGALKCVAEVGFEPQYMEESVYCDRHLVAGSFDFRGRMRSLLSAGDSLADFKSGTGVYDDYAIQLAGYGLVADYLLDADGKEQEWKPPHSYFLIHIKPDDYGVHRVDVGEDERRAFLACLEIRRWQQRSPIGPALPQETPWNLEYTWQKIQAMTHVEQLELSQLFAQAGLSLRLATLSPADVGKAASLVELYELREREQEDA